jgi:hypothetical protein
VRQPAQQRSGEEEKKRGKTTLAQHVLLSFPDPSHELIAALPHKVIQLRTL